MSPWTERTQKRLHLALKSRIYPGETEAEPKARDGNTVCFEAHRTLLRAGLAFVACP